jgi:hypothetical protein
MAVLIASRPAVIAALLLSAWPYQRSLPRRAAPGGRDADTRALAGAG